MDIPNEEDRLSEENFNDRASERSLEDRLARLHGPTMPEAPTHTPSVARSTRSTGAPSKPSIDFDPDDSGSSGDDGKKNSGKKRKRSKTYFTLEVRLARTLMSLYKIAYITKARESGVLDCFCDPNDVIMFVEIFLRDSKLVTNITNVAKV